MNKVIKTRNFSATQTLQYFNSSQNLKSKDSDKLKLDDIKLIYDFLYTDNFSNILIQTKETFMNSIESNIKDIIRYHFDDIYINTSFFQQTMTKYQKEIELKYTKDYLFLNEQYTINKNNLKENERNYLSHFLKHCLNTCQYAYHHCPNNKKGKFILVEDKDNKIKNKATEIKYVICIDCKQCYPSTCINMICTPCNHEYLSSVLKDNEDTNIVLATWEKYHCGGSLQDQVMKCIKCKKELYINLTTNKLICLNKNCNFEAKPNSILWKCSFCSKDFRSKVKVYNPLEFQNMKKAINNALLMKIKANPKILPCCKKDTKDMTFFHKEECKGILYKGFLTGKEILVCRKCHAMNFSEKFHWICPNCGKKFHLYHASSVTPFKLRKSHFHKENININNNSGKKTPKIFFVRKESSSSFNHESEFDNNLKNNDNNDNINVLNSSKDDNSYNLNLKTKNFNSYKNIRKISNINNMNNNYNDSNNNSNRKNKIKEKEKEKNGLIKMIKIPQKEKENKSGFRNAYKNKEIYLELDNDGITPKHKKKKRKTLYEVLEDRKKQSIGSIKNISLKNTIESVVVERNFNHSKNIDEEKIKHNHNENDIYKLSQTPLLPNSSNNNIYSNNNIGMGISNKNRKFYGIKVTELINDNINKDNNNKENKDKNLNIVINNKNSKDNIANRNKNCLSFMNSSDDLLKQKKLMKCKSYNIFNNEKDTNESNISNKNNSNNINHQTNYLYTTNSNYNIKVSLNINHNICPYPKKENNSNKKDNENNYKKIYQNDNLNKIKEIYLQEILKNTGVNLEKEILLNNNEENIINRKNNIKKYNINNIGNLSPKNNFKTEINFANTTKNENVHKIGHKNAKKDYYYKTSNNINNVYKNCFLNSNKGKENKKLIKDFNFKSEYKKNEPKKLIVNSKFNFMNKSNTSTPNIINAQNKTKKRYNLNYINIKSNENNVNNNSNNNSNINNNESNNKLKNIEEITKEDEETYNKTKLSKLKDTDRVDSIVNITNKNIVKDKFKYDLMKNVIVSPETISQFSKDSIIPIFNDKDYRYIRPIGEGAYGLIYLVENIHNRKQFALKKILCKDLYEIMKHKNQLELIYSMNHKNLMEIYNLQYKHLDNTTYAIYVLMERAQNDWSIDIRKRIINKKPYKEEEIINILKQVVSALAYLQKKNIAHRDIKPQNILLFQGNLFKVADMGEARNVHNVNNKEMTLRGSELYMSPSLYARHKFNRKDAFHNAFKSDVFSLGFSTLYAMQLNLRIIENIRELNNMKIIINSIHKDMSIGKKNYSEKLMKLIFKMIEVDENKRYDFIELEKELNSNF